MLSLDLTYIMDVTGSMGSFITEAKRNLASVMEQLEVSNKGKVKVTHSFIVFRDHPPQDRSFENNKGM